MKTVISSIALTIMLLAIFESPSAGSASRAVRQKASQKTRKSVKDSQSLAGWEAPNKKVPIPLSDPKGMFVEQSIGALSYSYQGTSSYCGEIIKLKSTNCLTYNEYSRTD